MYSSRDTFKIRRYYLTDFFSDYKCAIDLAMHLSLSIISIKKKSDRKNDVSTGLEKNENCSFLINRIAIDG